jgi:galactose oxidase
MRLRRVLGRWVISVCTMVPFILSPGTASAQVREVVVGITPTCPYGLEACWAGAYEALMRMDGVKSVAKVPNGFNSTATIRMRSEGLPDPDQLALQFKSFVDEAYVFRGVEVAIKGVLDSKDGNLVLSAPGVKQEITLAPLQNKLQWNFKKRSARQPEPDEKDAYQQLVTAKKEAKADAFRAEVVGPLRKTAKGMILEVREFFLLTPQK